MSPSPTVTAEISEWQDGGPVESPKVKTVKGRVTTAVRGMCALEGMRRSSAGRQPGAALGRRHRALRDTTRKLKIEFWERPMSEHSESDKMTMLTGTSDIRIIKMETNV